MSTKYHIMPVGWQPDFARFRRAVTERKPGPVPIGDLYADLGTLRAFFSPDNKGYLHKKIRPLDPSDAAQNDLTFYLERSIDFYLSMGWDFATVHGLMRFSGVRRESAGQESGEIKGGRRSFMVGDSGPIISWQAFERYKWPESPGEINQWAKKLAEILPAGMKIMNLPGGLFEWTTWLMGLVPFSYALYDQPDLVDAVISRVAKIIYKGAEEFIDLPESGGFFIGDDMGFFSGTLIDPGVLREKFFPHLKKMVDLAHSRGKLALLHSCGNLTTIMDDICATGLDGKHSFEDKIMPVEEVYRRWGDRIGLIGGVDVNLLASGTEEEVRTRVRQILEVCGTGGGYVLGTGNSVASYIHFPNYLAMLEEGRKWNSANFGKEF
jgi:uroporphyrinogen decarboxylase